MLMICAMTVAVLMEKKKANKVGQKAGATNCEHKHRAIHYLGLKKSLDGIEEDGKAKRNKKNTIHKRSQSFCPLPLPRLLDFSFIQFVTMGILTPYVYIFGLSFWLATLTAHSPTQSESTSLS